ncbi:hypothetical protein AAVH_26169, partial [Aphelenchoides avenae]
MEHLQPDQVPPDQVPPADESVDHPGDPDGGQRMGGDGVLSNNPKAQDETDQLVEPLGLLDLSSEGGVSVRTEDERAIMGDSPGDHSMDTDVGSDVDDIASDDAETIRDDTSSAMVLSPRMESGENAPHAE